MTENADLQSIKQELKSRNQTKNRELAEAQQKLREKVGFNSSTRFYFWLIGGRGGSQCRPSIQNAEGTS